MKIVLLRETQWVQAEVIEPGGGIYLNMPEQGTIGEATVEAVDPVLVFKRANEAGVRMITGTFRHSEGWAGDLKLKSESKPIGVTSGHLFWSVDRQDWVSVGDLEPGETVKTLKGTTTVESYTMREGPEPVYNLEVERDHVYRVGDQGILVHNTSDPCACFPTVQFSLSGNASAVAAHISAAQAAGKPKKLKRDTNMVRRMMRRNQVCPQGTCSMAPAPNNSCDEYPFASTWQGGTRASVRCVPSGTNSSQGGTLGNFYTQTPINDGDEFCVEVVP